MRFVALIALLAVASPAGAQRKKVIVTDAEVMKVHRSAILIDTHNDVTSRTVAGTDLGKPNTGAHTDLPRLQAGGVGAVFFAAYVSASYVASHQAAHRALEMIDTVRHDIAVAHPEGFVLARSAGDIEAAHRQGKVAALIGVEGGHAIENSLRILRDFYALGARYMTLTHSNTNDWADSSGDIDKAGVKHHNGLTDFGRDVIREMNGLGMMVDISHVSDKTFWDALQASRAPVFASHSSCRAVSNIPRNMTDEMIVALAKKGGVIQINFGCEFLSQKSATVSDRGRFWQRFEEASQRHANDPAARAAELKKLEAEFRSKVPRATIADVVAQIDHAVKIAGIDAVGIGTDFDGVSCVPEGLDDVSKFPNLTRALLESGYSGAEIRKIYGGNTLRVMRMVEAAAK